MRTPPLIIINHNPIDSFQLRLDPTRSITTACNFSFTAHGPKTVPAHWLPNTAMALASLTRSPTFRLGAILKIANLGIRYFYYRNSRGNLGSHWVPAKNINIILFNCSVTLCKVRIRNQLYWVIDMHACFFGGNYAEKNGCIARRINKSTCNSLRERGREGGSWEGEMRKGWLISCPAYKCSC